MKVLFLFRSKKTGFSIEELFNGLVEQVRRHSTYEIGSLVMPYLSSSVGSMVNNMRFVRRCKADIYHITGDNHYLALGLPSKKTVLTVHDCIILSRQQTRRNPLRFAFFWLFWYYLPIWKAGAVTTISGKSKKELIRYLGRRLGAKVVVIPNFCDPTLEYTPKSFRTSTPVLLQIGTGENKNLARIVEAIAGIPCRLEIVGPLDESVRHKLNEYSIAYGHSQGLSRSEVIRKYQHCDLVLFASTYEGFGMPILEANAIGRPVITSDLSPMREVAGLGAHLVNPYSVDSIRQGVLKIMEDKLYRERLIKNGLANCKRYSDAQVTAHYKAIYGRLYDKQLGQKDE